MAEIEIQRKQGGVPAWAWILGLMVLGYLIWWLVTANSGNRANTAGDITTPTTSVATVNNAENGTETPETAASEAATPTIEAANANLPLGAIQAKPDAYFNQWVSGMATVTDVLSDHAFWIEQDGKRMLVVKADNIVQSTNIVSGNKVSFSGMVVNPAQAADRVPSLDKLQESTRQTIQSESAFIHATNIEMQNS